FFFPDLLTDKDGSVVLRFTMPEALTRWKLMGLAHTQDLKLAQFTKEVLTQKPLMVVPNLPRFLRAGDRITLTAKVNALEGGKRPGTASLELFDPYTNKSVGSLFGLTSASRPFIVAPGQSANVGWDITVPEGVDVVSVRIIANASGFSDGEEKPLPILTDKVLVTESLPLWSSKAGTKTFTLDKLKNNTSTTLRHQSLKLEYTPNPAWYAVQALPYLMEFPHECAEQTFSRFYANALATHIVNERPVIKQVFDQWKQAGPAAFASALEKNADLKNIILSETPWVVNAKSDRERKERIGLLFDMQRMGAEEATALKKLRDMQLGNGAWPWWSGMRESRYITQHIVAGFGHLEKLGAADLRPDGQVQQLLKNAVDWLDREVDREYRELVKRTKKEEMDMYPPSGTDIHYLYARSFFPLWPINGQTNTAVQFYKQRLAATWLSNGLQEQAMIALALDRLGDHATAQLIMESLKQRATQSEELGMYWKGFAAGYDWWQFPTETHALMIEAFHEVAHDEASVNALRTYLLKLKQTTDWKTTKGTAEACYALLLSGNEWLSEANAPIIKVGGAEVKDAKKETGTGTFEKTWTAGEVKPAMGEVSITTTADKPSWGALHWQYFEQMDKVTPHESPFSVKKEVMLTEQTEAGPRLVALGKSRALKPGDKLTIRIELRADRYVDYVHMKDLRAAGLEPTEAISGYKYQGGSGYYQSIRDASMNFFFDRIAPGTYVFEYALRVTHGGNFSNGITTAQCMYAPEFSSHSNGIRVDVVK
ncbi:MAG: alpha-2-macroglobulin family protein, partial [Flavobacteriales bacterium]